MIEEKGRLYSQIFCIHGRWTLFNALIIFTISIIGIWMLGYMMSKGLSLDTHSLALWTSRKSYM